MRTAGAGMAAGRRPATAGQMRRTSPSERPRRASPRPGNRPDLGARLIVAIPAIAVAAIVVWQGGLLFAAAAAVVGCLCLHELYQLTAKARPVRLAGFAALLGLVIAAYYGGRNQVLLVAVAALPLTFLLSLRERAATVWGIAATLLGVWWVGIAIAHAVLLRDLPHGGGILVDVLVGTFVGDTGAYFGGRAFGRRPLAPSISPAKTVEGLVIGIVCAIVAVWFASLYQPWLHKGDAVLIGVGVALAGPVGDLFESFVKRQAGVKDSGRIFGAHGGALDRLDATLFTVVVGYYIWLAILTNR